MYNGTNSAKPVCMCAVAEKGEYREVRVLLLYKLDEQLFRRSTAKEPVVTL